MVWHAGAVVRCAGVYSVTHRAHRPTHETVLQQSETFPVCRTCGMAVKFDFVRPVTESDEIEHAGYDLDFMESVLSPTLPKSA